MYRNSAVRLDCEVTLTLCSPNPSYLLTCLILPMATYGPPSCWSRVNPGWSGSRGRCMRRHTIGSKAATDSDAYVQPAGGGPRD